VVEDWTKSLAHPLIRYVMWAKDSSASTSCYAYMDCLSLDGVSKAVVGDVRRATTEHAQPPKNHAAS
jgi:hypothetical protein